MRLIEPPVLCMFYLYIIRYTRTYDANAMKGGLGNSARLLTSDAQASMLLTTISPILY